MPPKKGNKLNNNNNKKKNNIPKKRVVQVNRRSMPLVPSIQVMRPSNRRSRDVVKDSDDAGGVLSSKSYSVPLVFPVYANNPLLFPRGAAEAKRWDLTEIISFGIEYEPYFSEMKDGVVIIAWDPDATRDYSGGITAATLMNMYRILPRVSQRGILTVTRSMIHDYLGHTRRNPQATPTTPEAKKDTCFGQLIIVVDGVTVESPTDVGRIVSHYNWRFYGPQLAEIVNQGPATDASGTVRIIQESSPLSMGNDLWLGGYTAVPTGPNLTFRNNTAAGSVATAVAAWVKQRLDPFGKVVALGGVSNLPATDILTKLPVLSGLLNGWLSFSSFVENVPNMIIAGADQGLDTARISGYTASGGPFTGAAVWRRRVVAKNETPGDLYFEFAVEDPILANCELSPLSPAIKFDPAATFNANNLEQRSGSFSYTSDGGVASSLSSGSVFTELTSTYPSGSGTVWNAKLRTGSPFIPVSSANGWGRPVGANGTASSLALNDQAAAIVIGPGESVEIVPTTAWGSSPVPGDGRAVRLISGTPTLFEPRLPGLPFCPSSSGTATAEFPFWCYVSQDADLIARTRRRQRQYGSIPASEPIPAEVKLDGVVDSDGWTDCSPFYDDEVKISEPSLSRMADAFRSDPSKREALAMTLEDFRKSFPRFRESSIYKDAVLLLSGL